MEGDVRDLALCAITNYCDLWLPRPHTVSRVNTHMFHWTLIVSMIVWALGITRLKIFH